MKANVNFIFENIHVFNIFFLTKVNCKLGDNVIFQCLNLLASWDCKFMEQILLQEMNLQKYWPLFLYSHYINLVILGKKIIISPNQSSLP